jgi:hypothetical protein
LGVRGGPPAEGPRQRSPFAPQCASVCVCVCVCVCREKETPPALREQLGRELCVDVCERSVRIGLRRGLHFSSSLLSDQKKLIGSASHPQVSPNSNSSASSASLVSALRKQLIVNIFPETFFIFLEKKKRVQVSHGKIRAHAPPANREHCRLCATLGLNYRRRQVCKMLKSKEAAAIRRNTLLR